MLKEALMIIIHSIATLLGIAGKALLFSLGAFLAFLLVMFLVYATSRVAGLAWFRSRKDLFGTNNGE